MNHPKFEVGETVILQSSRHSEYNGEYVIEGITKGGDIYKGVEVETFKDCWHYDLGFITKDHKIYSVWAESSLRKKHKPAEMSFSTLMQSLTSPVGVQ